MGAETSGTCLMQTQKFIGDRTGRAATGRDRGRIPKGSPQRRRDGPPPAPGALFCDGFTVRSDSGRVDADAPYPSSPAPSDTMRPLRLLALLPLLASPACHTPQTAVVGNAPPNYAEGDLLLPHDTLSIRSAAMGERRPVNVYLPDAYAAAPSRRFPVLYMPDGGEQEDFPHLTATVDSMIAEGAIPPVIVVGIANTVRRRDLTPETSVASDREVAPVVGRAAAMRAFVASELMPEIDRRYRTDGTTAVVGESLAGLWIVDTFFAAPVTFGTYVALSPSLWWNDRRAARDAPAWLAAHRDVRARLYLTHADETDIAAPVADLDRALRAAALPGLTWTYRPRPDLTHATIYRATKRDALRWALGNGG